jgi:branched-chain amino acid transport system substrate-binding protein
MAYVNERLGGVDGRPLELQVCNTGFSAEGSAGCGQQFVEAGVPAVLGGIDVFGTAIEVLGDNGVPYLGGIPISDQSVRSDNSFQWSGGIWGATVAFADHAIRELGARRVAIIHGDFGSINEGAEFGRQVLERADVDVRLVPYPILANDLTPAVQAAIADEPDAVMLLAADAACAAAFQAMQALEVAAQKYFVGACAAPPIIGSVEPAATDGTIFNVEGPVTSDDSSDQDNQLYSAVVERYGDGLDPIGAGTVSFRSFMNLYRILVELGDGGITAEAVTAALREQVDAPSFMGHPSTCDGEQFADLRSICSPQQRLAKMQDRVLEPISDWIDVGRLQRGG